MVARGEVRWLLLDDASKRRPVVILTRDAVVNRLTSVLVGPVTSTIRGLPSEVPLGPDDGLPQRCVVSLDNTTQVNADLLGGVITRLSPERMAEICSALALAVGCDRD